MYEFIFSTPWWFPVLVVAGGAFAAWTGNQRGNTNLRIGGIAIALLGILLAVVSYLVETPIEKCSRRSVELVKTVEAQDWPKVKSLMDANITLSIPGVPGIPTIYSTRDELIAQAAVKVKAIGLRGATGTVQDARRQGQLVTTSLQVWTDTDVLAGHQFPSTWELDWEEESNGWVIREIRAIKIGNQDAAAQRGEFPGGK